MAIGYPLLMEWELEGLNAWRGPEHVACGISGEEGLWHFSITLKLCPAVEASVYFYEAFLYPRV